MEGAEPRHALDGGADQVPDPLAHLARGLVGEGDAQDLGRPSEACPDQVRQARGQGRGFAGAGARQHQHRAFGGQHRLALGRVEVIDQGIGTGVGQGGARGSHP
jgi:hypothetical protein